ncbi:deoxyuridine 5'-triphosphate nucleotidohydrolase [Vibrio phage Va2]|nr:deoxyuridine 5'-triphosphate nucleotidohydrolase [Vibrio phage Va2]
MSKKVPVEVIYTDPRFDSDKPEHEQFVEYDYGREGDAGIDLRACIDEPIVIKPGERITIDSGFKMWLKDGLEASIMPRSGLGSKQGIVIGNLVGLIDGNYQGNVGVCVWNSNSNVKFVDQLISVDQDGAETYAQVPVYNKEAEFTINPGDRICQMKVAEFVEIEPVRVDEFSGTTARGEKGFGSSGVK